MKTHLLKVNPTQFDWAYKTVPSGVVMDNGPITHHEFWLVCRFRDMLMQLKIGCVASWLITNFYSHLDFDDDG